ncbi:hypothetical protein DFJ74DRAFT_710939 [Hyaloraphidium curvatum]|nr:hypothetical protein DFJ74DRAFT_710939 [Hyaloraphidium curvatum]
MASHQFSDPSLFPFEQVEDLPLIDPFAGEPSADGQPSGAPVRFGNLYTKPGVKSIVIFGRNLLDYFLDLDRVDKVILRERHVSIIVVTPAPAWAVRKFVASTGFSLPMYSDPSRELYKALDFNFVFDSKLEWKVASRHVRTTVPAAWALGFFKGVTEGVQGDPRQQGGAFVLGPGKRECSFVHFDRFNADHAPIPVLLEAVGIKDWKEAGVFKWWDEMTPEEQAAAEAHRGSRK